MCTTDFSPGAIATAGVAAKLAVQRSEDLRLVHAMETRNVRAVAETRARLEAEAARLRKAGVNVEPLLLEGASPTRAVLDQTRVEGASLVVVASGVKGPLDRWAIGSFSEKIAEASPVPTLVVRDPSAFDTLDGRKGALKVLLALDLFSTSDVVLRWAREFQLTTPCEIVSCHINLRMPTTEEAAVAPGRPVNPPEIQARLERELRKKVRDQLGDDTGAIMVKPYFGDPAPCVVEVAREIKAHVIAVGTHQRRGLSRLAQFSVSRELLHESGANVVCVPVSAKFDPREAHLPEFRRVLVTTDFSELGNTAIPFACSAASIGGLVKIIHIATPRGRKARDNAGRAQLMQQLRALIPNETGARGQPPQVEVVEASDVAEAICAEADRFGADLVCVASHGLGASRALHGSVTKAILKKIRRPLLVIRRPEE